jgi:hypothetical protein
MCNTIVHMFEGVRPFDRLMLGIEVLVVLLIAWEIFRGESSRRQENKRRLLLSERMNAVQVLLARGGEIRRTAPSSSGDPNDVIPWVQSLEEWDTSAQAVLGSFSPQAAAAFTAGIPKGMSFPGLAAGAQNYYGMLLLRLDNLQKLMEKSDVYF